MKRLMESHGKHAALAQLYRWWLCCDDASSELPPHRDFLDESVLATLPRRPGHWQDSHFMRASTLDVQDDGTFTANAQIEHLNVGMDAEGAVMRSVSQCRATLRPTDGPLPRITGIHMAAAGYERVDAFVPAYAQNRIRSLVHYFTSLVEDPRRDPDPFQELLAEGYSLNYIDPPIESADSLSAWVKGPLSSVVASQHVISGLHVESKGDQEYLATIDMHSEALFPDGSGVMSRNTQRWTITDDRRERFARIRQITIRREPARRFEA